MTYTARELRLDDEEDDKKQAEPNAFLEEALFKARTILLTGGIDFMQARRVCERLLALSSASTTTSLGPGSRSTATRPNNCRLASTT